MNDQINVRRATSADAIKISQLCKRVYPQVYSPLPSSDHLHEMMEQKYGIHVVTQDIEDENKEEWLAVRKIETQQTPNDGANTDGEEVMGLLLLTRGTDGSYACLDSLGTPRASMLEVERIYIDFPHHSKGVGQRLMNHAEQIAREQGLQLIWLCTWKGNDRAIQFYRKLMYDIVGEEKWDPRGGWVMAKKLE